MQMPIFFCEMSLLLSVAVSCSVVSALSASADSSVSADSDSAPAHPESIAAAITPAMNKLPIFFFICIPPRA
jgi:hypothetical protein